MCSEQDKARDIVTCCTLESQRKSNGLELHISTLASRQVCMKLKSMHESLVAVESRAHTFRLQFRCNGPSSSLSPLFLIDVSLGNILGLQKIFTQGKALTNCSKLVQKDNLVLVRPNNFTHKKYIKMLPWKRIDRECCEIIPRQKRGTITDRSEFQAHQTRQLPSELPETSIEQRLCSKQVPGKTNRRKESGKKKVTSGSQTTAASMKM